MHKSATKCNETLSKWCKNKHGASKIMDTLETYQSPLDITYEKQKAIKSQILPDFTAEWLELQNKGPPDLSSVWTMYFDGSKRIQGVGAGVVLISPQGDKLKYVLRMSFPQASNNKAEYEALLHGMKMAKACGAI
jgi:hypothetical protein